LVTGIGYGWSPTPPFLNSAERYYVGDSDTNAVNRRVSSGTIPTFASTLSIKDRFPAVIEQSSRVSRQTRGRCRIKVHLVQSQRSNALAAVIAGQNAGNANVNGFVRNWRTRHDSNV
jgi:hypothetical protein